MAQTYLTFLETIAKEDVEGLRRAQREYGDSWLKRGGCGAYMMACRKFDRLEIQAERHQWDIFKAIQADERSEGAIDDVRDLRRYLMLIEAEMRVRGAVSALSKHRDNEDTNDIAPGYDEFPLPRSVPRHTQEHPFGYDPEIDDK